MKPLYLFLLALMMFHYGTAQKRNPKDQKITSRYYNGTLFAKVNFGSLLDVKSPTIQTGLEYRFNKKLSAEFSVGIPIVGFSDHPNSDTTYHRYYKLRAELHFFPKSKFFYIGPEILFMRKQQSKYNGNIRLKDALDYNYTYAELDKTVVAFGIKLGRVFPLSEKLNLEGAFSFGTRIVSTRVDAQGLDRQSDFFRMFKIPEKEGTVAGIHYSTVVKLAYTIF